MHLRNFFRRFSDRVLALALEEIVDYISRHLSKDPPPPPPKEEDPS